MCKVLILGGEKHTSLTGLFLRNSTDFLPKHRYLLNNPTCKIKPYNHSVLVAYFIL